MAIRNQIPTQQCNLPAITIPPPQNLPSFFSIQQVRPQSNIGPVNQNPLESLEDKKHTPYHQNPPPPYLQNFLIPPPEDYYNFYQYLYQQRYNLGPRNDYIPMVYPNIININNVNTLGNALIINGHQTPNEPKVQSSKVNEFPNKPSDGIFKITIDEDYYQKKYAL